LCPTLCLAGLSSVLQQAKIDPRGDGNPSFTAVKRKKASRSRVRHEKKGRSREWGDPPHAPCPRPSALCREHTEHADTLSSRAPLDGQVVNGGDAAQNVELKYVKKGDLVEFDNITTWDRGNCGDGQGIGSSNDALTTDSQLKRMAQMAMSTSVTCLGRVGTLNLDRVAGPWRV